MTLRRSSAGLNSLHLFHNVEAVVFCEGGDSLTVEEVLADLGSADTLDIFFWKRLASYLGVNKTLHFKSIGSKSTLESIARDVIEKEITTILFCLDRDYDWHINRAINNPQVIYSFGYSWENDVFCVEVVSRIFLRLLPNDARSSALVEKMADCLRRFSREVARFTEMEIALAARSRGSIFDRKKPLGVVDMTSTPPKLSVARAKAQLCNLGYKRGPRKLVTISDSEVLRHSFGHLVARYIYQVSLYFMKRRDDAVRPSFEVFVRLAISETFEALRGKTSEQANYYGTLSTRFT